MNGTNHFINVVSNVTSNPGVPVKYVDWSWILTEFVMLVSTAIFCYILFRLVEDEIYSGRIFKCVKDAKPKRQNTDGIRLQRICIATAVFDLLQAISSQSYMITFSPSSHFCDCVVMLGVIFYSSSLLCTFTFLWCRQRALYSNQFLKHLSTKFNQVVSWISIAGIYLTVLVPAISMLVWRRYEVVRQECKFKSQLHSTFQKWYLVYTVGYFASQLLLGWLYVHPLLEHKRRKKAMGRNHLVPKLSSTALDQQNAKFRSCIVKSVTTAACCVISDVVSSVAVTLISRSNRHRWTLLIPHSINLTINLLSMVGCFVHWRELVFPCCSKTNEDTAATSAA